MPNHQNVHDVLRRLREDDAEVAEIFEVYDALDQVYTQALLASGSKPDSETSVQNSTSVIISSSDLSLTVY